MIDASGMTLLSGLVNTHAHVSRASHVQMALDAGVDELVHMIYDEPPAGLMEEVAAVGVV